MESLGEFLQNGRARANLTLEDLAGRTRIRVENLRALEKGELEELPSEPYVRGFVKLVCRELGLAPEEGIVRYDILREALEPTDEMTWEAESIRPGPSRLEKVLADPERLVADTKRFGRIAVLAVGGVLVVGLLFVGVRGVGRWFAGREQSPSTRIASVEPTADSPPAIEESTTPTPPEPAKAEPTRSPEPEAAAPAAVKREPTPDPAASRAAIPPAETRAVAVDEPPPAENRPSPVAETPPAETRAAPVAESVSVPVARSSGRRLVLKVEALRAARVSVLLDGVGVPRTRSLAPGDSKIWKADSLFRISASDAGALRITLDDVDVPALGPDGVAVEGISVRPSRP